MKWSHSIDRIEPEYEYKFWWKWISFWDYIWIAKLLAELNWEGFD